MSRVTDTPLSREPIDRSRELMLNASMRRGHICKCCGWPVVYVLCNDGMGKIKPYADSDWWAYCANKTCEKHSGVPYQPAYKAEDHPEFVHVQDLTPPDHRGKALGL